MSAKTNTKEHFSRDAVFRERLVIEQSKEGYRFSIDALLLIHFAFNGRRAAKALDLGAGCGIIGLGLLASGGAKNVTAIELQPALAKLAKKNSKLNNLEARYKIINADIREQTCIESEKNFDLVTANPPFWPAFEDRLPSNEERRLACHEVSCGLDEWPKAAKRLMHPTRGRFAIVFPARRLDCLITALERSRLSGTRLKFVHPFANKAAELVLLEARFGQTGRLEIEPPLILKDDLCADTKEAVFIANGDFFR